MRHGRCLLTPDDSGLVCDRLVGLQQIISSESIKQALLDTGKSNSRHCLLTHEVMLWVVLAMGIFTNLPIRQVFKRTRFAREKESSPCRSSLCHARQRLGIAPLRRLFQETTCLLATPQTPGAFYKGMRLMGIDGVVFNLPDRDANESVFGQSNSRRGPSAFPQLKKISLVELGTHAEIAFIAKPFAASERAVVPSLLKHMPEDGLLLWDQGFYSYDLIKTLFLKNIFFLTRVSQSAKFKSRQDAFRWFIFG